MKLEANRLHYEMGDDSGYGFTVETSKCSDGRWFASVEMRSGGYSDGVTAVKKLRLSVEAFLKQLSEVE